MELEFRVIWDAIYYNSWSPLPINIDINVLRMPIPEGEIAS